jgi:hypothetical protein
LTTKELKQLEIINAGKEPEVQFPWTEINESCSDLALKQKIFLFYGNSGSGKSYLSAQFPKPLILACDPGDLGGSLSTVKFHPKHLKVSNYYDLINLMPKLKDWAGKEFKTLIIDSTTYLSRTVMDLVLKTVNREIPRFEEWNLMVTRMRTLINNFAEMNCDVIFTATEDMDKDKLTQKIYGGPNLPGQLATELPQACDVVLRLFAVSSYNSKMQREVHYKFQSVPDEIWFARDRTGTLPSEGVLGSNPHVLGTSIREGFEHFKHLFPKES